MLPGAWVVQAQKFRRRFRAETLAVFRDVDILLAPATPCRAPRLGQKTIVLDGKEMLVRPNIGLFTQPISFIGLPVVAAPVWTEGEKLPIGVQIIARAVARGSGATRRSRPRARGRGPRPGRNSNFVRETWPNTATPDGPDATARRSVVRQRVWRDLVEAQINIGPAFDRIPNFVGADVAAKRLSELDAWKRARVVKCNPDPPQIPVRLRALYDGKLLFSPVPYLTKGFPYLRIDPEKLAAKGVDFETAATSQGFMAHGEPIGFEDMPKLDFCVVGCVAVTRLGGRTGKGAGFADLEQGVFPRARARRRVDADRDHGSFLAGRRRCRRGDGEPRFGAELYRDRAGADRHADALSAAARTSPGTRFAPISSRTFRS